MNESTESGNSGSGITTGALIASAVAFLALPSAVLAFAVEFTPADNKPKPHDDVSELANVDGPAGLTRRARGRSLAKGQLFPFTPAGTPNRPDRSVTVAVRIDPVTTRAMAQTAAAKSAGSELGLSPTAFNLGLARGYSNFTQDLTGKKSNAEAPDLAKYSIAGKQNTGDPRFSPRIIMSETKSTGQAPRTFAGDGDDLVDLGGSYRVSKNIDVTAGVRYSQERERLLPVTDGKQDNQAVYVGTQFRF